MSHISTANVPAPRALIGETEVAAWYGVTRACLRKWRRERTGPAFFKLGSAVRYDPQTVENWFKSRLVQTAA